MKMIDVLVPLAEGQHLPDVVRDAIFLQTVPCRIVCHTSPVKQTGERLLDARVNECHNRNALLLSASEPYALYLNRKVMLGPTDVSDCIDFLDANHDVDAVALNTKNQDIGHAEKIKHVCCAALAIRTERWKGYQWTATVNECSCLDVNRKFSVRYLDNRQLKEVRE